MCVCVCAFEFNSDKESFFLFADISQVIHEAFYEILYYICSKGISKKINLLISNIVVSDIMGCSLAVSLCSHSFTPPYITPYTQLLLIAKTDKE